MAGHWRTKDSLGVAGKPRLVCSAHACAPTYRTRNLPSRDSRDRLIASKRYFSRRKTRYCAISWQAHPSSPWLVRLHYSGVPGSSVAAFSRQASLVALPARVPSGRPPFASHLITSPLHFFWTDKHTRQLSTTLHCIWYPATVFSLMLSCSFFLLSSWTITCSSLSTARVALRRSRTD